MTDLTKSGEEEDPGPPVTDLPFASTGMEDDRVGMSTRSTRRARAPSVQRADEDAAEEEYQADTEDAIAIDLSRKSREVRSYRSGHCLRSSRNRVPTSERFNQDCAISQEFSDANLGKKQVGVITPSTDDEQRQMQQQAEQRQEHRGVRRWTDWANRRPRSEGGQRSEIGRRVEARENQNLPKWPQRKRSVPRNRARNGGMRSAGQTLQAPNVQVSGSAESSGERHRSQGSNKVGNQQRILESAPNRGKGTRKAPVRANSSSRATGTSARGKSSAGDNMVPTMRPPLPVHLGAATPKAKKPPRPRKQVAVEDLYHGPPSGGGLLSNDLRGGPRPTFNAPNGVPDGLDDAQNLAHVASEFANLSFQGRAPSLSSGHGTGAAEHTFHGIGTPLIRGGEMNGPGDESFDSLSQSDGRGSSGEEYHPGNGSEDHSSQGARNAGSLAPGFIQYTRRDASSRGVDEFSQNYLVASARASGGVADFSSATIGDEYSRLPSANAPATVCTRESMLSACHTNSVPVPTSLNQDESPNVESLGEKNSSGERRRGEPLQFDLNELPEMGTTQKIAKRKKLRPKVLKDDPKVRKPKTTEKKKATPKPKKAATPRRSKATDTQTGPAEKRIPKRRKGASDATANQGDGQVPLAAENGGLGPIHGLQSAAESPILGHIQASSSVVLSPATPANMVQYQTGRLAMFDSPSEGIRTPDGFLHFPNTPQAAVFRTPMTTFSTSEASPVLATPSSAFASAISPAGNNLTSGSPGGNSGPGRKRSGQQSLEGQRRQKRVVRNLFHNASKSAGDENGLALAARSPQDELQCEVPAATQMALSLGQTQAGMPQLELAHSTSRGLMVSPANASGSMTEPASCTSDAGSPRRLRDAARRTRTYTRRKPSENSQIDAQSHLNNVRMVDGMAEMSSEEILATGLELATMTQSRRIAVARRKKIKGKAFLEKEDLRMFKLIMTHGAHYYDPKDPQAEKWARERIFMKRRAEEFITRMHLFQGDRQFSIWGGSVTDSVIGAFLTQNVSDHLSSSAFINVISTWPMPDSLEEEQDEDGWDAGVTVEEVEVGDNEGAQRSQYSVFVDGECTGSDVDRNLGGGDWEAMYSEGNESMEAEEIGGKGVMEEANCGSMDFEGEAGCEVSVSQSIGTLQNNDSFPPFTVTQYGAENSSCAQVRTSFSANGEATPSQSEVEIVVDLVLEECTPPQAGPVAVQDVINLAAEQKVEAPDGRKVAIETGSEEVVDGRDDNRDGCPMAAELKSGLPDLNVEAEPELEQLNDPKGVAETALVQTGGSAAGLVKQSPKSTLQCATSSDESPPQSSGVIPSSRTASELEDGGSSVAQLQPGAAGYRDIGVEGISQELREDAADVFQEGEVIDHGGAEKSPKVLENKGTPISPSQNVGEAGHGGDQMSQKPSEFAEASIEKTEVPLENTNAPIDSTEGHSPSSKIVKVKRVYSRRFVKDTKSSSNNDMEDVLGSSPLAILVGISEENATEAARKKLNWPASDEPKENVNLRTYARRVSPTQLNPGSDSAALNASPSVAVVSVSDPQSDTLNPGSEAQRARQGNEVVGKEAVSAAPGSNERRGRRGKRGLTAAEIRDIEYARTTASKTEIDWEEVRKKFGGGSKEASLAAAQARANGENVPPEPPLVPWDTTDMGDWAAMKDAPAEQLARVIRERGMGNMLSVRIMGFLQRLEREHGTTSLEWLRKVPPETAKAFLMSIRGLGLKSVECIRLLTLHQHAFPVDTNVGRICVRLGWVPIEALPSGLLIHNLELYPVQEAVQKYLWPRLCKFDQPFLYELHYQLITFGKVFCTKTSPNCHACPMNDLCAHYQSVQKSRNLLPPPASSEPGGGADNPGKPWTDFPNEPRPFIPNLLALEAPVSETEAIGPERIVEIIDLRLESSNQPEVELPESSSQPEVERPELSSQPDLDLPQSSSRSELESQDLNTRTQTHSEASTSYAPDPGRNQSSPPITYRVATTIPLIEEPYEDIDGLDEDDLRYFGGTMPDPKTFRTRPEDPDDRNDPPGDLMKAIVQLRQRMRHEAPPLKQAGRLRTSHYVYELPDNHPTIKKAGLRRRRRDDPSSYLLVVWGPGQRPTKNPGLEDLDDVANVKKDKTNGDEFVKGTILVPCRSAMRGKFPLNGTYFQVNEVFADHASSINPIQVPRKLIWGLRRRFVYFGTSVTAICRGLSQSETQACFWKGYVCVRGFDCTTRAPVPLDPYLHEAASRIVRQSKEAKAAGPKTQRSELGGEGGTTEDVEEEMAPQQGPKPRRAARKKRTAADSAEEGQSHEN